MHKAKQLKNINEIITILPTIKGNMKEDAE